MPGGAQAVREPWRNLYAQLIRASDWPELARHFGHLAPLARLAAKPLAVLDKMIASGINAPLASSCGRLFDAVAAALDICPDRQAYEGEAAMRLEAIVDAEEMACGRRAYRFAPSRNSPSGNSSYRPLFSCHTGEGRYPREKWVPAFAGKAVEKEHSKLSVVGAGPGAADPCVLDPASIWPALLSDLADRVPAALVAARFHWGLAQGIAEITEHLTQRRWFDTVALSGGCFQNAVLFGAVSRLLQTQGFTVLSHAAVPANDGGLALGQAAIAAARLIEGDT